MCVIGQVTDFIGNQIVKKPPGKVCSIDLKKVFEWPAFETYKNCLNDRSKFANASNKHSNILKITTFVPQGSSLKRF